MSNDPDLTAVLKGRRSRAVGPASASELARRQAAYLAGRPNLLGHLDVSADGRSYGGFYEALLDPAARFDRMELTLRAPGPPGPAWDFIRPFQRIAFQPDGSADLHPRSGPPERTVARLLPRDGFGTPPSGREFGAGRLPTLVGFAEAVRSGGFVPFAVALELYGSSERARYELDLTGPGLLPDPRAGRIPPTLGRRRPSRASWNFDRLLSGMALPSSASRVLEIVWESGSVSEAQLARVFGESEGGSESILKLSRLHLIEADPSAGGWRVRPNAMGPTPRAAMPSGLPRDRETPLRHTMGELLAGAEARATCPMCGEEFPPGYRGLLCEKCTREVENATPAS